MNCAPFVKKLGHKPNKPSRLAAKFTLPDIPDFVKVKGTGDINKVRPHGVWVSGKKNTGNTVTLVLIKNGKKVQECPYNMGQPVPPGPVNNAAITNYNLSINSGVVSITWTSTTESNLAFFAIDRKPASQTDYDEGVDAASPQGAGTNYSIQNNPGSSDTYNYRLRAVFNDGTDEILAEGSISANPPQNDAAVTNYKLSAASNVVSIEWTSTAETGLAIFVIDSKVTSAPDYNEGVDAASPQGVGTNYSIQNNPGASGDYSYRLRALFNDGSDEVLAEETITA